MRTMTIIRRSALLAIFAVTTWTAFAQPGDPPGDDPDAVPISGLEYLAISGGVYGVVRILRCRKGKRHMKSPR